MDTENLKEIARKAEEIAGIQNEAKNIRAFIVASMLKLLAFQTDMLGNVRNPPKKTPNEVKRIANEAVNEFLKEVYDEPETGDSEEGTIQNPSL